jgi:hypothetical protein
MSVERRGQVIRVPIKLVNWQQEEPTDCGEGRQLFQDDKSRVSRKAQARFCEGLGVQLPGATRPSSAGINRQVVGDETALQERRAANPSWPRVLRVTS